MEVTWQLFSKMEILLHQRDRSGNLVSGFYDFDADVVRKETGLSIPVANFQFKYIEPVIQFMFFFKWSIIRASMVCHMSIQCI